MPGFGDILAYTFYGATFVALGYFVHKVLWLTRFRVLQAQAVKEASDRMTRETDAARQLWMDQAVARWLELRGDLEDPHLLAFALRVLRELEATRGSIQARRVSKTFVQTLDRKSGAPKPVSALELTRLDGTVETVKVTTDFDGLRPEPEPDARLYDLALRSRYGFVRRALAFFLGAADVVYSSQHLARMSQNTQVPLGLILRRLSLVVLILLVVMIDISLGARSKLIVLVDGWMGTRFDLPGSGGFAAFFNEQLPTVVALALWLAGYGAVYIGLYLFLHAKSQKAVRRLQQLRDNAPEQRAQILSHHAEQLESWVSQYAGTLDEATDLTVSQATMLIDRAAYRLRRRVVISELVEAAEAASKELFKKLPEASTELQDVATSHKHSLAHQLWPRLEELGYQRELARYRGAWQYLEATLAELRGETPDPVRAIELWATLVSYEQLFQDIDFSTHTERLEQRFPGVLRSILEDTTSELGQLDHDLEVLTRKLRETFVASNSLVASRVELTQNAMRADLSTLSAEILRAREQARLEAMAFEI